MVTSGEWDRINRKLKRLLDESGWTDETRDRAIGIPAKLDNTLLSSNQLIPEEYKRSPNLKIRALESAVTPQSISSVPIEVKKEIMEEIRQFVEENLERP
ncbi:uncharacterized protein EI90DRAFT_3042613 [Cantharellus anzutake]|uniref:uncharacterized protein n=1 Tax=Cantharellus anzutake TaxID=1750568 RepID=UPI001905CE38|nr:uncharacterized protein EI90DRAFT_3089521 [Cantharellus anzutake]XP_038919809.1 uncharacterized protein EI90DRAFT_3042613 [Cantharellus anzutake]KAF8314818.1 hypothetical protein EI90DRAFT_3089521 [Cantharellus anzutake]KAF8337337.1 hypothetical protein EI90DRAFT_3042613 [Cantharellus anzutake]